MGWLIPGAGHLIQRRWIRGLLLFVSIATLFVLGLLMQGHIYKANGGDILDILGFIGDLGAGGLYILTLAIEWGQGAIAFRNRRLWNEVHDRCRIAELHCGRGRLPHRHREKAMNQLSSSSSSAVSQELLCGETMTVHTHSFQCGSGVRTFCVRCLRHHPSRDYSRHGPLWPLLFRHVPGWHSGGGLGHVADPKIAAVPAFNLIPLRTSSGRRLLPFADKAPESGKAKSPELRLKASSHPSHTNASNTPL